MKEYTLFCQNVRGLRTKCKEMYVSLFDSRYSVIAFSEAWLCQYHSSASFFPKRFAVYRADREYGSDYHHRGGVLLAVRNDIIGLSINPLHAGIIILRCNSFSILENITILQSKVSHHSSVWHLYLQCKMQ